MWSLRGRASLLLRRAYDRFLLPNTFYHSGHASLKSAVSRRELSSQGDANCMIDQDGLEESHCEFPEKEELLDVLMDNFDEERKEKIRQNISRAWRKINLNPHNPKCKAELIEKLVEAKSLPEFRQRYLPNYISLIAKLSNHELYELEMYFEGYPEPSKRKFTGVLLSIRGAQAKRNAVLVEHYITVGLKEDAKDLLKKMEGEDLQKNPRVGRYLLLSYAKLGDIDEVRRIWELCQACPQREVCLAAIESFAELNKIDEAEAAFEFMSKRGLLQLKNYSLMLKIYANNKMVKKGNDLVMRMTDNGIQIGPLTWDDLVKLYIKAGEVEKAETVLQEAVLLNKEKPYINSYTAIMEHYANRGDIHSTKMIWQKMKEVGYKFNSRQYEVLLQAYLIAKLPAHGMRGMMKADNIVLNPVLRRLLVQVDPFHKIETLDLRIFNVRN
ncbi:hypothetical protein HN51_023945 [Arachis hypogaea]|uniref:pentatricopeptide repeat-containing protein At1g80270, mitochondrial isoform X1 n=2 Tax=Arachis hypogaea TaxID=3818 RepID=UPI000DEC3849|nr:pentatricopeptide repeat-containing protein At1g80270, mitochondrial isoform X1 [Arachis hypogaea]